MLLLLLLVSYGAVGAVLIVPALPAIQQFFDVSVGQAQLTVTAYLIGYGVGQLGYGPLANGLGRKKALAIGLSVAIVGSLACIFAASAGSFSLLVFARFLQALGATAGLKISYTMVADLYDPKEAAKHISRFILAFAIMPGIGTALGGLFTEWFGWESCLYFLVFYGVLLLALSICLPETAKTISQAALQPRNIIEGYLSMRTSRQLILCAFITGSCASILYTFASKSPFIGINLIGLGPQTFGLYSLIPSCGMVLGAFINPFLIKRFSLLRLVLCGSCVVFIGILGMLIPFATVGPSAYSLFLPTFVIYAGQSIAFANVAAHGLSGATNKANASAVLNFITIACAVITLLASELFTGGSPTILPLIFLFFMGVIITLASRLR